LLQRRAAEAAVWVNEERGVDGRADDVDAAVGEDEVVGTDAVADSRAGRDRTRAWGAE
jgi:hypothetical protein